jgi:5-methylcytosine-specific restriction endonuclease McrA
MIDVVQINNPEYRWLHKKEMKEIMTHTSIRNDMGVKVLDYNRLREENDSKIRESNIKDFDWDRLKSLVDRVSFRIDKNKTKTVIQPQDHLHFESRDKGKCFVCRRVGKYCSGKSHLHHIIPNGDLSDDNIVTLCVNCHQLVHLLLFMSDRWKYARPL